jgi:hypothetical protein
MVIEPVSLTAAGNWVLARVDYRGCPRNSEIEVRQQSWELSLWRGGACHRPLPNLDTIVLRFAACG